MEVFMGKKEIIGQLYSLRAGISFICLHIDNYNNISSKLNAMDDKLSAQINKKEYEVKNHNSTINKLTSEYNKQKQQLTATIKYYSNQKTTSNKLTEVVSSILIPGLIPYVIQNRKENETNYLLSINKLNKLEKEYKESYKRIIDRHENTLNDIEIELSQIGNEMTGKETFSVEKRNIKYRINIIFEKLIQKYSIILNASDWQYLDYVIYCLETGRADTIKEALLLVDKHNRHNELLQAINNACHYLSNSINSNINNLGYNIKQYISKLNDDIKNEQMVINNSINKLINDYNYSSYEQKKYLNALIQNTSLSDALLEKINISSDKMLLEINKIVREEYL
jgi:hypothetical protein